MVLVRARLVPLPLRVIVVAVVGALLGPHGNGIAAATGDCEPVRASNTATWYIKAQNTGAFDAFGRALALSVHDAVVGAPEEDSSASGVDADPGFDSSPNSGAAYVFRFNNVTGAWEQSAYLKASNNLRYARFGSAVAASGDRIVVGARWESACNEGVNDTSGGTGCSDAGAAYIFDRRSASPAWAQTAYLKAALVRGGEEFGAAVAVAGDLVAVGAPHEPSCATGVDGDPNQPFCAESGAATIFARGATGAWAQAAYLKAPNARPGDQFGTAVAASWIDTVFVGAPAQKSCTTGIVTTGNLSEAGTDIGCNNAGAVYIYARNAGNTSASWQTVAFVKASTVSAGDFFGASLATTAAGDRFVVGAPGASAAFVFAATPPNDTQPFGGWEQVATLTVTNGTVSELGKDVGITNTPRWRVVAGGFDGGSCATGVNDDDSSVAGICTLSGAAYLFAAPANGTGSGSGWELEAYVKATNTGANDIFGTSVAVSGDTVFVGAPDEDSNATGINGNGANNDLVKSGAVYAYELCSPFASGSTTGTTGDLSSGAGSSGTAGQGTTTAGQSATTGVLANTAGTTGAQATATTAQATTTTAQATATTAEAVTAAAATIVATIGGSSSSPEADAVSSASMSVPDKGGIVIASAGMVAYYVGAAAACAS